MDIDGIQMGARFVQPFTVTEKVYEGFIELFKDSNPLHTDHGFAMSKGFKGRVMFGNILNGFISYFVGECLPIKNVIILAQEIKFSKPMYLNDRLNLNVEVTGVFESVGTIELGFFFTNQTHEKVAKGKLQIGVLK